MDCAVSLCCHEGTFEWILLKRVLRNCLRKKEALSSETKNAFPWLSAKIFDVCIPRAFDDSEMIGKKQRLENCCVRHIVE